MNNNVFQNPFQTFLLTLSVLDFLAILTLSSHNMPQFFLLMTSYHWSKCIIFLPQTLVHILAITLEPLELDRFVTTHLKTNHPLYTVPVVFLSWGISRIMDNVPWPLVNAQRLFGYQSLEKYFDMYVIVKNKEHGMTINHVFLFITQHE